MAATDWPQGWWRRLGFRLGHLLLATALTGMMLGLVHQYRANVGLRREDARLEKYQQSIERCIRTELFRLLQYIEANEPHLDAREDYIEAEKRFRQHFHILLFQLPDREELMRRLKHEHDTGGWGPDRIKEAAGNDQQ